MTDFISVPFNIAGMHSGFSEVEGIGKFSSAGIVLEFEAKILGLFKTGVKESHIPLTEISDVKFKKGVFKYGAKIEIRLKSFAKLSELKLPHENGKITLKIPREDHQRGAAAVQTLQRYFQTLPPANISVSDLFDDETKELE